MEYRPACTTKTAATAVQLYTSPPPQTTPTTTGKLQWTKVTSSSPAPQHPPSPRLQGKFGSCNTSEVTPLNSSISSAVEMGNSNGTLTVSSTSTTSRPTFTYFTTCYGISNYCPPTSSITAFNPIAIKSYNSNISTLEGTKFTIAVVLEYQYDPKYYQSVGGTISLTITADLSPDGTKLINPIITTAVAQNVLKTYTQIGNLGIRMCTYERCTYGDRKLNFTASASYNYNNRQITMEETTLTTTVVEIR